MSNSNFDQTEGQPDIEISPYVGIKKLKLSIYILNRLKNAYYIL